MGPLRWTTTSVIRFVDVNIHGTEYLRYYEIADLAVHLTYSLLMKMRESDRKKLSHRISMRCHNLRSLTKHIYASRTK